MAIDVLFYVISGLEESTCVAGMSELSSEKVRPVRVKNNVFFAKMLTESLQLNKKNLNCRLVTC